MYMLRDESKGFYLVPYSIALRTRNVMPYKDKYYTLEHNSEVSRTNRTPCDFT